MIPQASFAINLTGDPTFGSILNQARGEKVEVVLQQTNATQPGTLSGTVVGIEKQKLAVARDTVDVEILNLWCGDGMRSLKMSDIQRVRFLNPILDSEFKKALETLAQSHDTQKKSVSINCTGEGKREVRVGYVIENPIWKTSYRLVLDKKENPYLQGWAIVENPTDEDWKDVRMALVSGRPISFRMDLYQSLFVHRPVVESELFASLRPPTYNGDLGDAGKDKIAELMKRYTELYRDAKYADAEAVARRIHELDANIAVAVAGVPIARNQYALTRANDNKNGREDYFLNVLSDAERAPPANIPDPRIELGWKFGKLDLRNGVGLAASAAKLGDFFQYAIDKPVTLPRQKSAMLRIVAKDIAAQNQSSPLPAKRKSLPQRPSSLQPGRSLTDCLEDRI